MSDTRDEERISKRLRSSARSQVRRTTRLGRSLIAAALDTGLKQVERIVPRRHSQPGRPPGALHAPPQAASTIFNIRAYDESRLIHQRNVSLDDIAKLRGDYRVIWIDLIGLGDTDKIGALGALLSLHPLALEDALNPIQRVKLDWFEDSLFWTLRQSVPGPTLQLQLLSVFLGSDFVVTARDTEEDCLNPLHERLERPGARIRSLGPDYLAYAITDAAVDHIFPILERVGEELEELEDFLAGDAPEDSIALIRQQKRLLLGLRRYIFPLRDITAELSRDDELELITENTRVYLRDCHDHAMTLVDNFESCREMASGLMEAYHSAVAFRTNEAMRVLTVISSIFIPLSFLAGLYGMNFDPHASPWNMPELQMPYAYPILIGCMFSLGIGLLFYFRRRGWL